MTEVVVAFGEADDGINIARHGDDGIAVIMIAQAGNNSGDIGIMGLECVCLSCCGRCWW